MGSALIPGAELQTPDSMIFDPFEINEIEDEIIEFHGEQDPDRNYFNQFSHQLSKSSNYYIEDSFKGSMTWSKLRLFLQTRVTNLKLITMGRYETIT